MDPHSVQAQQNSEATRMASLLRTIDSELRELSPYFSIMRQQLVGALTVTDRGVIAVIERINSVHGLSSAQIHRIQQSMQQCMALVDVTKEQSGYFQQMAGLVRAEIDSHLGELDNTIQRTQNLSDEVKELTKIVNLITDIASQTKLLAINAAIQATHAGQAGATFTVVASEVKLLSLRTSEAAKDIAIKIGGLSQRMADEMATVKKTAVTVQASSANLQKILENISSMEAKFNSTSSELKEIIGNIQHSNSDVLTQLTEALGHIQFQDVVRQRVEQVENALLELNEHTQQVVRKLSDEAWDGSLQVTLKQRLDHHQANYVMASQRDTHASVFGDPQASSSDGPAIELF